LDGGGELAAECQELLADQATRDASHEAPEAEGVQPATAAARIAMAYALLGALWIVAGQIIFADVSDVWVAWIEISKGLLYVTLTAVALYFAMHAALRRERRLADRINQDAATARSARRQAEERHAFSDALLDTIQDRIWVFTADCHIRRANAAGWLMLGRLVPPDHELDLEEAGWPNDSRALLRSHVAQVAATGAPLTGRIELRYGDDDIVVDYSNRPLIDPATGQLDVLSIAWDVTEQVAAEAALARKNRILTAVVRGMLAIAGHGDRTSIARAVTCALVEEAGFALAWIGELDDGDVHTLRMLASCGPLADRLPPIVDSIRTRDDIASPTQEAIRTGKPCLWNGLHKRPDLAWASGMFGHDLEIRSCIVVPMSFSGRVFATLSLYGHDASPFSAEELGPIEAFGGQLGRALATVDSLVRYEESESGRLAALSRVKAALIQTLGALAAIVEVRDPYTAGHQRRVAAFAETIAREKGWSDEHIEGVRIGALLHDIGKIAVPAELLNKITRLNPEEFALIKTHTTRGGELLSAIDFDWPILEMVTQHHERLDGSGYPAGMRDNEISTAAKLLAVADVTEAMLSHRPYRRSVGMEAVIEELTQGRGRLYEPESVDIALRLLREHGAAVFGAETAH
jgi:putative nucleotidyltransferase with HDIG domain